MSGENARAGADVVVAGTLIHFAQTAIDRYGEHVRPTFSAEELAADLARLAPVAGEICEGRPSWLQPSMDNDRAKQYLMLGDDIAFPLMPDGRRLLAVTCVERGGLTATQRVKRSESRHFKRAARNLKRKGLPTRQRPPTKRGDDADEEQL